MCADWRTYGELKNYLLFFKIDSCVCKTFGEPVCIVCSFGNLAYGNYCTVFDFIEELCILSNGELGESP